MHSARLLITLALITIFATHRNDARASEYESLVEGSGEFQEYIEPDAADTNSSEDQKKDEPTRPPGYYPANAPLEDVDSVTIEIHKQGKSSKTPAGLGGRLYLKVNERVVATWGISSGGIHWDHFKKAYRLYPTENVRAPGVHPISMDEKHVSSSQPVHKDGTRGGAPMPYSIFFTSTGQAIHAGSVGTSSHGCIHLGLKRASQLFHYVKKFRNRTRIIVSNR